MPSYSTHSNYASGTKHGGSIGNDLMRKVYGILTVQLLTTAVVSVACMFHPATHAAVMNHFSPLVSFVVSMGFLFACEQCKDSYPLNMYTLAAFTLSESFVVGAACASLAAYGFSEVVLQALILTAAVTTGLSVYALRSKRDFSFMGATLHAGLSVLCFGGLASFVLGKLFGVWLLHDALDLPMAIAGAGLFSGFIVYDTQKIARKTSPDEYIKATITLYLDIVNLFLDLMRILLELQANRQKEDEQRKRRGKKHQSY